MKLSIRLETFEGPLDLLFHLIDKNKVNIYDIPIAEITDQYMQYVNAMDRTDLDLVSDFLVMAATLLDIKSKMLLPVEKNEDGEEIDPRQELVERLIEYKMYKTMAQQLKDMNFDAQQQLYKIPTIPAEVAKYEEPVDLEKLFEGVTLQRLHSVFEMVMKRQIDKLDPIRSKFGTIQQDPVRLSDKLGYIFDYAKQNQIFQFQNLLESQHSKIDIVVTFLACLELIKIGKLFMSQEEVFGDIILEWNPNCTVEITKEDMEQYD